MNAQTKIEADNMAIWNAVSKTNPAHTKHVGARGGFTAIAAHSQIMAATKQFGPIGEGWGYDTAPPIFTADGCVVMLVTVWHGERENTFGPMPGCAQMSGNRVDTDAPKKATTDGLTKLLSHLGFNADVFLGMFDDNKYVQALTEEFSEPKKKQVKLDGPFTSKTALQTAVRGFVHELNGCGDGDMLTAFLESDESKAILKQCERDAPAWLEGSDKLPADYEPINYLIERLKKEFEERPQSPMEAG